MDVRGVMICTNFVTSSYETSTMSTRNSVFPKPKASKRTDRMQSHSMNGKKSKKKTTMCQTKNSNPLEVASMNMNDKLVDSKKVEPPPHSILFTFALCCALVSILFFASRMEDRSSTTPKSALSMKTPAVLSTPKGSAREIFFPDMMPPDLPTCSPEETIPEPIMKSKSISTTHNTKVTTRWSELQRHIQDLPVSKILVDFGVFVLFRAVGWPAMKALGTWLRRVSILKKVSPDQLQILTQSGMRIWKTMVLIYSRTAASKFVNRGKKLLYPFLHHDDHGDNHHSHH